MKIVLNKGQQIFFGTDWHLNHSNIAGAKVSKWKRGYRNYESVEEMNGTIINNINSKVGQDDILFFLGDFCMGDTETIKKFRKRIVCKNIHFILGNHDKDIRRNKDGIRGIFTTVQEYLQIVVNEQRLILFHYPIGSWDQIHRGSIHLHGHCHETYKDGKGKMMDVHREDGLPYSLDEILKIMKKKEIIGVDHHE